MECNLFYGIGANLICMSIYDYGNVIDKISEILIKISNTLIKICIYFFKDKLRNHEN